jgi:hypothetical protein
MLVFFFFLFVLRVMLRKPWLVMIAFVAAVAAFGSLGTTTPEIDMPLAVVMSGSIYIALTRFGFVTSMIASYVNVLLTLSPITSDVGAWYFGTTVFVLLFVLGIAGYGLQTALAGRSIVRDELL